MRNLFTWAAAHIVAAFAFALPLAAMAEVQMTNPVTGELESYTNAFVGASPEWNSADNWDTGNTPFISGNYDPALVTGTVVTTATAIDGWTLRVGAYNGATVYWSGGITKIQAGTTGCWLTADETSAIEIKSFAGNQLEGSDSAPFKLSSANANGIVWVNGITNASDTTLLPFWYYLKGAGTVVYRGDITVANAQVIKQADITLSGTLQVASKTLVTFGFGTTKAFSADASIKVKNANGDVVRTVPLTSVTAAEGTTLTTDDHVGSCELVQTSTGIVLYYVDGDPENLPVYKPSININFTNGNGNGLTTAEDVGLSGYAVPGATWNNFTIPNNTNEQTFSTVNAIDSTGMASVASGVSIKVSGHRGSYSCGNLTAASNPFHGYIDEGAQKATPTVTITGIPYEHYRVIVYHSTDTANVPFGYDTINGFNFTYVNGVQTTGTDSWGASGADQSAEPIAEGTNTLVSAVLSGDTVTMVAHRIGGGTPTARGCFAAIQVVEYVPEVGEDDLEIAVNGATDFPVDAATNLSGTVYLTGSGTLTLSGSEKITAATIDVGSDVILNINADRLDATNFTGAGTVVYDGTAPVADKGWTAIGWSGTVWIKNQSISSFEGNQYGNSSSTIRFTGVTGFLQSNTFNNKGYVHTVPLELVDDGDTVALTYNNGWGGNLIKINTLKGSGTLKTQGSGLGEHIYIVDGSGFTGVFNLTGKYVYVGGSQPDYSDATNPDGKLDIRAGTTLTVPSGKTWTANGGFVVDGTIIVDGTLASSHSSKAVSGSGTVVFTGRAPTPAGDTWWKNAAWTGTVEIKDATIADNIHLAKYGNAESKVCMNGASAYLYARANAGNHNIGELVIGSGGFVQNGTYSSGAVSIDLPCKLTGTGTYSWAAGGSATKTVFLTGDTSEFNGKLSPSGTSCRFVVGETSRDFVAGSVVVGSNKVLKIATDNTSYGGGLFVDEGGRANITGFYWSAAGVTADGVVSVTSLNGNLGGGTAVRLGDTGVLEVTRSDSPSADDGATDYARVTGTGTIRFAGYGFTVVSSKFPTDLTFDAEKDSGSVVPVAGATIGSLMGDKGFRSDWGQGGRYLTIKQSKNTVWNGSINVDGAHRLTGVVVDPGESTTGTLTMTATQTATSTLAVNGSVNLTGTWVGATTVAGTFGGTGTLTGNLTFGDGATFKANASALSVSGTVMLPTGEGESLAIDATGLDGDEVTILSSSSITTETDVSKVTVNGLYAVEPAAGALKLVSTKVTVTVPAVANTTVIVVADGDTIGTEPGAYKVAPGSVVTVTYAAVPGYRLSGMNEYTIDTAIATTFDPAETTQVRQYVASITNGGLLVKYTTLQEAVDAVANNKDIVLLANEVDGATVSREITFNVVPGEYTCGDIVADGDYVLTTTALEGKTRYTFAQAVIAVTINEVRTLYTMMTANTGIEAANAGPIGTTIEILSGDPTAYVEYLPMFDLNTDTGVFTKVADPVAAVYDGVLQVQVYGTLADAFGAAEAGQTIKVLTNNTLMATIEIATDNLTLDLNGCTVTGAEGDHIMFEIKEPNKKNVDFKIKDSSAGQTGKAYSAASKVVLADKQNCTFTLESGTLESGSSVPVYILGDGTQYTYGVTISGGTLKSGALGGSEDNSYCVYATSGTITFTDGTIDSTIGAFRARTVNVSGGDVTVGSDSAVCYNISTETFTYNFTGGTFNKDVSQYVADGYEAKGNGDGTYTVCKCWIYAEPGYWDYTGTWEGATIGADKVTFQSNATYTASSPSAGQLVTVEMKLSFDDANDDEDDLGDAKAAVRLASGEAEGPYQFQLYTTNGLGVAAWESATVTGISATTNVDYTFVFVLDLTNKTYTASIVSGATTNALSVGGRDEIPFACQSNDTPVQRIDFVGSGTVTSIKGSYGMPQKFVPGAIEIKLYDVTTNITLTIDQADWLNACGSMSEVRKALAEGITAAEFDRAYLMNLNILDKDYEDVEKPLSVTAFDIDDANVAVEVTLIRKGKLDGGINGVLKLKGTTDLATDFGDISETPVGDDDFSDGDTATWEFTKGSEKFYKPVIVPVIE